MKHIYAHAMPHTVCTDTPSIHTERAHAQTHEPHNQGTTHWHEHAHAPPHMNTTDTLRHTAKHRGMSTSTHVHEQPAAAPYCIPVALASPLKVNKRRGIYIAAVKICAANDDVIPTARRPPPAARGRS
ncbi:hypothetical protein EVAR_53267_1 [Eumeta japonica]|uniref:Uncharacterized protein n=1 Tax=Eumeta variegata TaxID=151549 RepID=A0A4C1YM88_EUMVA|nr:hypothetical protein EVAR_53267_1 [Eumeta japonica]